MEKKEKNSLVISSTREALFPTLILPRGQPDQYDLLLLVRSTSLSLLLARSLSFSFSLSALQTNELFIDNNTDGSRNNPVGDWNKPLRLAARFLNANQVSKNVSK